MQVRRGEGGESPEAGAQASLRRARESYGVDPKPGELPMDRVRRGDNPEEARTVLRCKAVGGAVGRGEIPIEPGDSWFSPKCIEVQPHERDGRQVALCIGTGAVSLPSRSKRRMGVRHSGSETVGAKLDRREGKSPDRWLRSQSAG